MNLAYVKLMEHVTRSPAQSRSPRSSPPPKAGTFSAKLQCTPSENDENVHPNSMTNGSSSLYRKVQSATPSSLLIASKDLEIDALKQTIDELKIRTREMDGKVVLLKFQLERSRVNVKGTQKVTVVASNSPDRQAWLTHWRRTQANHRLLRRSVLLANRVQLLDSCAAGNDPINISTGTLCDNDAEEEEEPESEELVKALEFKLAVQDNFIQRLRLQMHDWVETQISNHLHTAEATVALGQQLHLKEQSADASVNVTIIHSADNVIPVRQMPAGTPLCAASLDCPKSLIRMLQQTNVLENSAANSPRILKELFDGISGGRAEPTSTVKASLPPIATSEMDENAVVLGILDGSSDSATDFAIAGKSLHLQSQWQDDDDEEKEYYMEEEEEEEEEDILQLKDVPTVRYSLGTPAPSTLAPGSVAPYGSAEIRSAWKAWGAKRYTEVASAATINPAHVVVSPTGTTPGAFKEQMSNLRKENISIRDEISRFRQEIRRLREEEDGRGWRA